MPISSGALGKPNSYFNLPEKDRFKGNRVIPEDELKRRQNESGKRKISATDNSGGKGRKATTSTGIGGAAAGGAGSGKGGAGKDRKKKSKKSNTSKTKVTSIFITSREEAELSEDEKKKRAKRRKRCLLWLLLALLLLLLLLAIILGILCGIGELGCGSDDDNGNSTFLPPGIDPGLYNEVASSCKGEWGRHFIAYNKSIKEGISTGNTMVNISSTTTPATQTTTPIGKGSKDLVCCYNYTEEVHNLTLHERKTIIFNRTFSCTTVGECRDLTDPSGEVYPCISGAAMFYLTNQFIMTISLLVMSVFELCKSL